MKYLPERQNHPNLCLSMGKYLSAVCLCFIFFPAIGLAAKLEVPIQFSSDYLTRLLNESLFPQPEGVSVWGDDTGCNDLTLSDPQALIEGEQFFVITNASVQTGVQVGNRCFGLLRWNGKVKAEQRVDITDPQGKIAFSTIDTKLLNQAGSPGKFSNRVWKIAKQYVHPYLDRLRIDLTGAVEETRQLLPLFQSEQDIERTRRMIESVHLDQLRIADQQISAKVEFDIEVEQTEVKPLKQSPLSDDETLRFIQNWEQWDTFLAFIVKTAAQDVLDAEDKDLLLDVLIQTRYDLVDVLRNGNVRSAEALRESFIATWQLLSPVFRNMSQNMHGGKSLRFLGFIAAADALEALGQLGPVTGWDISVDGLRQLARILIDDPSIDPLEKRPDADPDMRELFDFDRSLQLPGTGTGSNNDADPSSSVTEQAADLLISVIDLLPIVAASETDPVTDNDVLDLNTITPNRDNLDRYLNQVQDLLNSVTFGTLMTKPLDPSYRELFHTLVLTTAWQETCWRQYRKRNGELMPMTSSAGALGMMQIMPRVWKGFYDTQSLARDIEYNAAAGTEILHRYLVRYALRKGEDQHEGGVDNLAKASYAAYNGGPKHLSRYRKNNTPKSLQKIDRGFWDKFQQVREGGNLPVRQCYS
ncbi:MAG: lytic transglycosylase domain-containing protein [Acidiferrobacterales bacterium]|nr:lytic transglycosylase domain-containing protein [Acidiferrobacterales bacterium]